MAHLTHQSPLSVFSLEAKVHYYIVNHIVSDVLVIKAYTEDLKKMEI